MTLTGPQKYPGADTSHWWQSKWGGDSMETNTIVWHTTEGTSLDDYAGGSMAPNFTVKPDFKNKRMVWYQHFDFDVSARALVHAGAVATNTLNVCQIEIIGTCDPATHTKWTAAGVEHLYSPELPDWAVRDLAAFCKWAHDNQNVPLSSGLTFKAYPGSYGTNNGVRMSNDQWLGFSGHCGHQHVPSGNVHGDPGAFPMAAILLAARGVTPPPPPVKTSVSLAHIVYAAKHDPQASQGHTSYKNEVLVVEKALQAEGLLSGSYVDGSFGSKTVTAYAAWQRKTVPGPYDGIPGKTSLTKLGQRHGFSVKD